MNPKISIAVDSENKAIATITGIASVGAKVDVEISGIAEASVPNWGSDDDYTGYSLRFRVVDTMGHDLVRYQLHKKTETSPDVWTWDSTNSKFTATNVDFNTLQLREAFFGVAYNDILEFGVIIDSSVDSAEYAIGNINIRQWAAASVEDPTILPNWLDTVARIDAASASVTKSGSTATISITDTHGNTTTAAVSDGEKGEQGETGPANSITVTVGAHSSENKNTPITITPETGTAATAYIPDGADSTVPGPANTLSIGTVEGGTTAGATITGTSPNQTLNLTLPKGDTGSQGDPGSPASVVQVLAPDDTGVNKWHYVYARKDENDNYVLSLEQNSSARDVSYIVPQGGGVDQVLMKNTATDYDVKWGDSDTFKATATVTQTATGATITCKSGTNPETTATVTNGTDGDDGVTPHIDSTNKHWFIGTTDTGIVAEGQDGTSSSASVTQTSTGATITCTTGSTTTTATVTNGTDGEDGDDGHSPVITASKSGKTTTIYSDGTQIATIQDGTDGSGIVSGAVMNGSSVTLDANGILQLGTVLTAHQDISGKADASDLTTHTGNSDIHVTAQNKTDWSAKQAAITTDNKLAASLVSGLADVATSGDYNDLDNLPTIPAAVTESTVSGWGFTKNTGTYSKPSDGIPKTDLTSAVQTSLGLADSALQSVPDLDAAKITSGTFADARIASAATWNAKQAALPTTGTASDTYAINVSGNAATATTATNATNATNDASGNVIASTYATKATDLGGYKIAVVSSSSSATSSDTIYFITGS